MNNNPTGKNGSKNIIKKPLFFTWEKQFRVMSPDEQKTYIHNLGNEIYHDSIELKEKKSKLTRAQKLFFSWQWH